MWKVPEVMKWMEVNVQLVLQRVDEQDPVVKEYQAKSVPRRFSQPHQITLLSGLSNIHRATHSIASPECICVFFTLHLVIKKCILMAQLFMQDISCKVEEWFL